MITRITGILNRVLEEEARIQVGGLEYQVLVAEYLRRQIQSKTGEEVTFHTTQFLEGNPMQGRVIPRFIGFLHEADMEFFDLFCTVDKVGIRKALKALARPIREIANAIQREDGKWLTSLPGIGAATADQIVAKLKKKVTRFALSPDPDATNNVDRQTPVDADVLEDAYQALLALGHSPIDARNQLDKALSLGRKFANPEEILQEIYKQ